MKYKLTKLLLENSLRTLAVFGVVVTIFAAANVSVSASSTDNCQLVITNLSGELSHFDVSNLDTATISVSIPGNTVGVWGSLVVGSSENSNIEIGAIPLGTKSPVFVTASKVNPNLPASYVLVATDSVGHSVTVTSIVDCPAEPQGCTYTQGFWKNKKSVWPVENVTLGSVSYTKAEAVSILKTPVRGNGLVSLSYQLIAAKLNVANGASVPANVATAITASDTLIGGLIAPPIGNGYLPTSATSGLSSTLDAYNNGLIPGGPPHCD